MKSLTVIEPHGFCAGVAAALRKALSLKGAYCLHEIVHNELVVSRLKDRGFKFVESVCPLVAAAARTTGSESAPPSGP